MKLDKAIEIKEKHLIGNYSYTFEELQEADRLSIEALKRLKECQAHHCTLSHIELPGETKE